MITYDVCILYLPLAAVQIFHDISQVILLSSLRVSSYPGQIRSPSARVSSAAGKNCRCAQGIETPTVKRIKNSYIVTVYVSQQ